MADVCAVHPDRPAVDACPVCGRGRCGPDAEAGRGGCAACGGAVATAVPPAGALELRVRAALASYAVAVVMGAVVSEYVGAGVFAYVLPFVLGVLCGEAAQRAAATTRPEQAVRAIAAVLAALGAALGLALEGSVELLSRVGLLSLAAAAAGALLWTVPPRARRDDGG